MIVNKITIIKIQSVTEHHRKNNVSIENKSFKHKNTNSLRKKYKCSEHLVIRHVLNFTHLK